MDTKKLILSLCEKRNTNYSTVAKLIGTTKQNISNKFVKNKFYLNDFEKIAEALNCKLEINFIDNDTGEKLNDV